MYEILTLNAISPAAAAELDQNYRLTPESDSPDAILLRSFKLHDYPLPESLLAVARCGAGVNNIPIEACTKRGIVVFNTPGANANAVKELVLCALFLASRKVVPAVEWARGLKGRGAEVGPAVEKGKSAFVGPEILGKKLGVIGLGAIGAMVANAAYALGMEVYGYDPFISVEAAWSLSRNIRRIDDLNTLFADCDYITLHVPYLPATREMINAEALSKMKEGVAVVNCARGELVNSADMLAAIRSGKVVRYVTDFPQDELLGEENVVCIPHLGASTPEAEDNCAAMAARQLKDYLENGNIVNSVNFPACSMPRQSAARLTIVHLNVAEMISRITRAISAHNVNIAHFLDKSQGEYAYSILELDDPLSAEALEGIRAIDGVISLRQIL